MYIYMYIYIWWMSDVWGLMFDISVLSIVYGRSVQWQIVQDFDRGACLGAHLQQRNGSGFLKHLLQQVDRLGLLPRNARGETTAGQSHREQRYGYIKVSIPVVPHKAVVEVSNRKPIGEVGCCESRMAERSHWWIYPSIYLPIILSIYLSTLVSLLLS